MRNRFFEKYIAGEHSLGTFTHLLSAPAIEALARAGLDYVIIDMEHSPIGAEHAAELVGVASGAGCAGRTGWRPPAAGPMGFPRT